MGWYVDKGEKMKIRNLTPHTVTIISENGNCLAQFPSEGIARAKQTNVSAGDVLPDETENPIPLVMSTFGEPEGLPDPEHEVMLIVSVITANAAKANGRDINDLLLTCDPVRDEEGRIIGCRSLALYR